MQYPFEEFELKTGDLPKVQQVALTFLDIST